MFNVKNEAREELKREVLSAGLMAERFPSVSSIVVKMNYKRGRTAALLRTVNFLPGSPAFFRISCLGEGCERGGLDRDVDRRAVALAGRPRARRPAVRTP